MKITKLSLLISVFSVFCISTFAQSVIVNRSALDALLGGNRADEGFELGPVVGSGAIGSSGLLSSTNSWGGSGFDLVVSGITFESTGGSGNYGIRWNGHGFRGMNTKTITANDGLRLDFWNSTFAFGIDLKDSTLRTVTLAGITIYGSDDAAILYQNNSFDITDPSNGTFFGFQAPAGIGAVVFSVVVAGPFTDNFSPSIDNLAFSTVAVPEPSVTVLALLGALALRFRKM